jgi:two-component system, OmpR family, alkaline phosphatase synthesis response regulator PhoP
MAKENILVIEDDEDIQELVRYNLAKDGYRVKSSLTGEEGYRAAKAEPPDLIVLDLMLPGLDGLELCRLMKADPKVKHVPIVMLTAKGEESDVVAGLELGAEDYVTKPFSVKVLIARIRALLRRRQRGDAAEDDAPLKVHDLMIHPGRHEVLHKGKKLDLTFTEFRLLHFLAKRPGWVFTRQQIVDGVKGEDYPVTDRAVDVQVVGLRKKLGAAGDYVETVRGVGYRFKE